MIITTLPPPVIGRGNFKIQFVHIYNKRIVKIVHAYKERSIEVALKEFAKITGNNFHTLEFFYEGKQIHKETPTKLKMQENDVVEVKKSKIFLKFRGTGKLDYFEEVFIQITPKQKMQVAVEKYAKMVGKYIEELIPQFNGKYIFSFQTAENLGMKDNDIIEVKVPEGIKTKFTMSCDITKNVVFGLKINQQLNELMHEYANLIEKNMDSLKFMFYGRQITEQKFPKRETLKENHTIEVREMESNNIRFIGLDDISKEATFVIWVHNSLQKVMKEYANIIGKDFDDIRFMFNGKRLWKSDIPEELKLKDNDIICVLPEIESINVKVIEENGFHMDFCVKFTDTFGKLKKEYEQMVGKNNLRFVLDLRRINADDTPKSLKMGENDVIEVFQGF